MSLWSNWFDAAVCIYFRMHPQAGPHLEDRRAQSNSQEIFYMASQWSTSWNNKSDTPPESLLEGFEEQLVQYWGWLHKRLLLSLRSEVPLFRLHRQGLSRLAFADIPIMPKRQVFWMPCQSIWCPSAMFIRPMFMRPCSNTQPVLWSGSLYNLKLELKHGQSCCWSKRGLR